MSDTDRIFELNEILKDLDRRKVPSWERPILEVARQAILRQLATLARDVARWDQEFRVPQVQRARVQIEFG